MICNQLIEATETLGQLRPRPSNLDIARAVCGNCNRNSNCPSLSIEQAEELERQESIPNRAHAEINFTFRDSKN